MPTDTSRQSNSSHYLKDLQREEDLNFLHKQTAFQRTVLPLLHSELTPPPLNRKDYPTLEDFLLAQDQLVAKVEVYRALLRLFEESGQRAQVFRIQLAKPTHDFATGNKE